MFFNFVSSAISYYSTLLAQPAPSNMPPQRNPRIGDKDRLSRLPSELLLDTFSLLDAPDLASMGATSLRLRQVATSDCLWRPLVARAFGATQPSGKPAMCAFSDDFANAIQSVKDDPAVYKKLSRRLQGHRRIVIAALAADWSDSCGLMLYVPVTFRADRGVALAAGGRLLRYFDAPLRDDEEIGRAALNHTSDAYNNLSVRLQRTPKFAALALRKGARLSQIHRSVLVDPDIAILGICEAPWMSVRALPDELFRNVAFLREAIQRAGRYAGVITRRVPPPLMDQLRAELGEIDETAEDPGICVIL